MQFLRRFKNAEGRVIKRDHSEPSFDRIRMKHPKYRIIEFERTRILTLGTKIAADYRETKASAGNRLVVDAGGNPTHPYAKPFSGECPVPPR